MTTKDKLLQEKNNVQLKLAIWLITTVSFYIIQYFFSTQIIMYITWFCAAYCLILFVMLARLYWIIYRGHEKDD